MKNSVAFEIPSRRNYTVQSTIQIKVGRKYIHRAPIVVVENGKFAHKTEDREVVLMATSGNYAMVRRPRAYPYTCLIKELHES